MATHALKTNGTRQRLIEAAGTVFAEKGFRKATVREIVRLADANLNAVNYHFGDKQKLYEAVFEALHRDMDGDKDFIRIRNPDLDPAERLYLFVHCLLRRALSNGHRPHRDKLMAMEMSDPSSVLDMVVEQFIRPRFNLLAGIVRELLGDEASSGQVELCTTTIIGQCIHLVHGRPITSRLMPYLTYSGDTIEELAEHVTRFSLAALKNIPVSGDKSA
jgi:TetR/AcrR family transcriptional regulator, regulator of cefoperazone and chloramphenicol sensitivity